MLNDQRVEHLRLSIQASTLLDDHEKADWLNLLELMNDKQLGELEEILAGPAPSANPISAAAPLSHISNLPTSIKSAAPLHEPVIQDSPSLIKAPKPILPTPPPSVSPMPRLQEQPLPRPNVPKVLNPRPQVRPNPALVQSATPVRASKLPPMNPLVLRDLSSVQSLSVDSIRQHEHSSVISALQMIAQSYGYFATLQNLEGSSLFAAYLTAGKNRLAGRPDSTLSQAEFELVADMLQAMRLNRS